MAAAERPLSAGMKKLGIGQPTRSTSARVTGNKTAPPKPAPPTVTDVTHHTMTLSWEEDLAKVKADLPEGEHVDIILQMEDRVAWQNVVSTRHVSHELSKLEPEKKYKFRVFYRVGGVLSPVSPAVTASTSREPLNVTHVIKQVRLKDPVALEAVLETREVDVNVAGDTGDNALMLAAKNNYHDIIEVLLRYNVDVNYQNVNGKTALMYAAYAGSLESIKLLVNHGARYDLHDHAGGTAMHSAVLNKQIKVVMWMLENGADVTLANCNNGHTPLHECAIMNGDRDVAFQLVMAGADPLQGDKHGITPLAAAIVNNRLEMVDFLLQRRVDIFHHDGNGNSAYVLAVRGQNHQMARKFEEYMKAHNLKAPRLQTTES